MQADEVDNIEDDDPVSRIEDDDNELLDNDLLAVLHVPEVSAAAAAAVATVADGSNTRLGAIISLSLLVVVVLSLVVLVLVRLIIVSGEIIFIFVVTRGEISPAEATKPEGATVTPNILLVLYFKVLFRYYYDDGCGCCC